MTKKEHQHKRGNATDGAHMRIWWTQRYAERWRDLLGIIEAHGLNGEELSMMMMVQDKREERALNKMNRARRRRRVHRLEGPKGKLP